MYHDYALQSPDLDFGIAQETWSQRIYPQVNKAQCIVKQDFGSLVSAEAMPMQGISDQ